MALIKSKELNSGVTVEYWRIDNIRSVYNKTVNVVITGYLNKTAREVGNSHLVVENKKYDLTDFFENEPTRPQIYAKLKESIMIENPETGLFEETNWFADSISDE